MPQFGFLSEVLPLDFICKAEELDASPDSLRRISSLNIRSRTSSNFNLLFPEELLTTVMVAFQLSAGKLVNDKISWRGDSGLKDGSEGKLDLSKGMYDAGDNLKFEFAKGSVKWITYFLINAHPSTNVLHIQVIIVLNPSTFIMQVHDHKYWEKPEKMTGKMPLKHVNASVSGSDIVAEVAVALASASLTSIWVLTLRVSQKLHNITIQHDIVMNSYGVQVGSTIQHVTNRILNMLSLLGDKDVFTNSGLKDYKQAAEELMCALLLDSPSATSSRTKCKVSLKSYVFPSSHKSAIISLLLILLLGP
ncbi:hypothetical protein F3Y22_tig00003725pilonHSYRG00278 [Hibiscus syriacus]|uniref:cellulase n=1 Tax=Hibiscus syriacus TaxID=106335 RepID=A0A6A3CJD6_HIBSY|nr:hypothetical protein F3Y22_tig00003725pilonHSYRG00278 [Hibiscus syriacus]